MSINYITVYVYTLSRTYLFFQQNNHGMTIQNLFLQDPVDPGGACPGPNLDITQYKIIFQAGSVVATENVNIARCNARRCSYTFEPLSNPPSSYDSVSVAAENVVGAGAARTCTTQTISQLNIDYFNTESVWFGHLFRAAAST